MIHDIDIKKEDKGKTSGFSLVILLILKSSVLIWWCWALFFLIIPCWSKKMATVQYIRESVSPIISPPLSFGESRFGLTTTSIELSSLKKVRDTSQRNLFAVSTFLFGFGNQLQAWVLAMMKIKWSFARNFDSIDEFPAEFMFHKLTWRPAENKNPD